MVKLKMFRHFLYLCSGYRHCEPRRHLSKEQALCIRFVLALQLKLKSKSKMEQVFSYIISLGASVMMPILFTIIGLCIGMKFGKSLKSGLYVGVGFVGLGIVTALLTNNFGSPLSEISKLYNLQLGVFDMGWPAAAAVAYNTAVGALIIPICLGVNFLLLITKCTRTVNIDLWNYWHFAFIGAVAYFVMDQSLAWGYFAAIVCYIITLVMADLTAEKFQGYYDDMDGISIPQPFCQSFTAFAIGINWLLENSKKSMSHVIARYL